MPVTVPTKTDGSIGREKREQPLNALLPVDLDYYETAAEREIQKDTLIALAEAVNDLEDDVSALGGLLFELNPLVITDLGNLEVQGKTGPSGAAFAGTVTATGNIASAWDSATKVLKLTTSGSMKGFGLRRVLCGTLPAAGFIVDLGIAGLGGLATTRLVLAFYEQRAGTNGRGVAVSFLHNDPTLYATGFGDDAVDSPAVNTSPLAFDAVAGGFANALADFTKGPARVVAEFRKVDASSPERWTMRVRLEGHAGAVQSHCYSGVSAPSSGWSTAIDVAGATMSRLALGAWCTSAEGGDLSISHLRVYSLGSAIPA